MQQIGKQEGANKVQIGAYLDAVNPLFEAYRPRSWSEFIGHEKAVGRVEVLRKRGLGGRAYWINGQSGTGKTTLAYLIAGELAGEFDIEELAAGAITPAKLRQIESGMVYRGLGKEGGRAYIINEAHGLSKGGNPAVPCAAGEAAPSRRFCLHDNHGQPGDAFRRQRGCRAAS